MSLKFKMMTAGRCKQNEKITNNKKKFRNIYFPAHFFLIEHPTKGYVLVDTGYSEHFIKETRKLPYSIYERITPVQFNKEESAKNQLEKVGVKASDIKYVFITHFHADHISGLKDFKNAKFICSKSAYHKLKDKKGIKALKEGFIPKLLPKDFEERTEFIEDKKIVSVNEVSIRIKDTSLDGKLYDLFSDRTIIAMNLPGHAVGQMGLYFSTKDKNIWLISDAVWDSHAYEDFELPSSIAKIIINDYKNFKKTLRHIHDYHKKYREVLIIPSHCRCAKEEWRLLQ